VNPRILFVEDSADDLERMLKRLREVGIEPHWDRVHTEVALREALAGERWELALVDYNLPGFGGLQALHVLAEVAPGVPAITVSGDITEETAVATITAGAVDYVLKDNLTRLAPAVQRAVEGADLRRRHQRSAEAARIALFAVDHASISIMTVAADGTIIYVNDCACDEFGALREDMVGAKLWDYDQYASAATWPEFWKALKRTRVMEFEVDRVRSDGRRRIVDVAANYLEGAECLISYSRDITDRRLAEEQSRASEGMYRRIVEMAGEGIWAMDGESRTTFVNSQMAALLGYEIEEVLGCVVTDFMFGEDLGDHGTRMRARRRGQSGSYQRRFRRKDGGEIWTSVSSTPDLGQDGEYLGSFAMVTDITERKRAEDALRESEERLRDVTFSMADWVWEVDENGVYTYSSQKGFDLFGPSREDVIGKTPFDFMPPDEAKRVAAVFSEIVANKAPIEDLENWNIKKNGERFCLLTNGVPILDEEGNLKGYRGVDKDITERKQAEDALRESEEQFKRFAEHLPGRLSIKDAELRYVYGNDERAAESPLSSEQWIGKTPEELWSPEEAVLCRETGERVLAGEVVDEISEWSSDHGIEYQRSVHFPIIREDESALVGGITLDVTEQVEAQEEVRRQAEQLRRTVEGAVLAMSHVVETRDPYTAGHERRVAELATAIAREMGMEGEQLNALRLAGLIHDIGKIAVPAEILSKPGRLSEVEFNLIKQHPESGFDILAAIDFGRPVAEMVLQHHERLDGSGYPRALAGADILPEARILAVADVVEAMSSHRPYRAALGMEAALAEIREYAGVKYGADVAAACFRAIEEQGFQFTP